MNDTIVDTNSNKTSQTKEIIEKDIVPHFLPTYRIKTLLYPLPIIVVIILAGVLAYLAYNVANVQVDGSYFPEEDFGAIGVLLNGIIFTVMAAGSAFIIIFLLKKFGMKILKYIFGLSFGIIGYFITLMFSEVIVYIIFIQIPNLSYTLFTLYNLIINVYLPILLGFFVFYLIYKYFTSKSIKVKNTIVLYISLLVSASMSIILPLWSTLAILIGVSLWDIFAVLYKRGPIKEMIDITSQENLPTETNEEELKEKIEKGEAIYDTSKLEIGIGDLAFYSLLTSSILIYTGNLLSIIFVSVAIILGTGITISGLKRNKILPGLPISIFLGIGTFLIIQFITIFLL